MAFLLQEAVQVDGDVMQGLLRHVSSVAYKHLDKHYVSPMLYCTEWLLCMFSRTLPWPCVLRLWDMFFCEGEFEFNLRASSIFVNFFPFIN